MMEEILKQLGINGIGFAFLYFFMNKTFNMQKDKDSKIDKYTEKIDNLIDSIQSMLAKDIQVSVRTEEQHKDLKEMYIRMSSNIKDSNSAISTEVERLRNDIKELVMTVNELKVYIGYCPHIKKSVKEE